MNWSSFLRADLYVANALNISRNKAAELIKTGQILCDGAQILRPSDEIFNSNQPNLDQNLDDFSPDLNAFKSEKNAQTQSANLSHKISVLSEIYVSRAALKLKAFLSQDLTKFGVKISGANVLDVGSSTGGFIQIWLELGAQKITGVDVGKGQLSPKIAINSRVKMHENTDIRAFKTDEKFQILSADVSFISLTSLLNVISRFDFTYAILLFKPQFEVGKEAKRDKKGVVKDDKKIALARKKFELEAGICGLNLLFCEASKVAGKEGNCEYFYLFQKVQK